MGLIDLVIRKTITEPIAASVPDIKTPLFKLWDKIGETVQPKRPTIKLSNVDWFDAKVGLRNGEGMVFGSWIIISGPPGCGKTTVGLSLLAGFAEHPDIETHNYDGENGRIQAEDKFKTMGFTPDVYEWEPNSINLLDRITQRAAELAVQNKSLVVLIDSFKLLGYSMQELQEAALKIKSIRNDYPNLLIITINHLTKTKVIEGPAMIAQLCDVWLTISKRDHFRYLSTPIKNRYEMLDAPDMIKLVLGPNGRPCVSNEPDFFSDNSMVRFFRNLPGKIKNVKRTDQAKTINSNS